MHFEDMSTSIVPRNFPSPEGHSCPHGMWHSTARVLEYVQISTDLATRLTSRPNHVAVFANNTESVLQSNGKAVDCAGVPIQFPGNDGYNRTSDTYWDTVVGELLKLKITCESGFKNKNINNDFYRS